MQVSSVVMQYIVCLVKDSIGLHFVALHYIAILGFSNICFVMTELDYILLHCIALQYWGGVGVVGIEDPP